MQQGGQRDARRYVGGQSTLEYVLVVAAILAAVIVAVRALIQPAVTQTMTDASNTIKNASGKVRTSLGL